MKNKSIFSTTTLMVQIHNILKLKEKALKFKTHTDITIRNCCNLSYITKSPNPWPLKISLQITDVTIKLINAILPVACNRF